MRWWRKFGLVRSRLLFTTAAKEEGACRQALIYVLVLHLRQLTERHACYDEASRVEVRGVQKLARKGATEAVVSREMFRVALSLSPVKANYK